MNVGKQVAVPERTDSSRLLEEHALKSNSLFSNVALGFGAAVLRCMLNLALQS